ncbi:hypothetical protein [Kineosporia succinea]|uniref:Uncharacterized protein n=1 Tax=Kineosporia succinea TaxID=84632 RepID=A0ABT9P6J7_9ACTN|nr:hypothetical protein [Kineosporia succinea]
MTLIFLYLCWCALAAWGPWSPGRYRFPANVGAWILCLWAAVILQPVP